jgi:hypothetical protein
VANRIFVVTCEVVLAMLLNEVQGDAKPTSLEAMIAEDGREGTGCDSEG